MFSDAPSQLLFDYKKNDNGENSTSVSLQKNKIPNYDYVFWQQNLCKPEDCQLPSLASAPLLSARTDIPVYVSVTKAKTKTHHTEAADENFAFLPLYWKLFQVLKEYYANPLSSLATSRTMLLPHQVQAALRVVHDIRPRVLIADEVGLGKTIETGLIIKELLLKYNYRKVLLVVPSPLLQQWKQEMRGKFNADYQVLNGAILKKDPDIVARENRLLVSVDLVKEERYRMLFLQENFDVVVFDEAHRLRRDQHTVTKAYQFADDISRRCSALLLLSATPFRGKLEEIYYLVQLLDPDIFGPLSLFLQEFNEENTEGLKEKISPVLIRRRKVDVGGFTKRFVRTVRLNLSAEERAFYDATTEYVKREYNRALSKGQRMKSFVMIVFQKLLDSSSYALLQALRRRKENLQIKYRHLHLARKWDSEIADEDFQEELSELSEEELDFFFARGDKEREEISELLLDEVDPQEMLGEIEAITALIVLGEKISLDSKLLTLEKNIERMRKNGHDKVLIFTQFKSTLVYVSEYLEKKYKVGVFHGSLNENEKEKAIEKFFQDTQVLILTEAGGEGRNLQIASALFNYDLPWSPLKIEQRIGRIHRFGQKKDVHVINFASKDTVAERVLNILENKIQIFENAMGESDALLGCLEEELNFHKNFSNFLDEKKSQKEWDIELKKSTQWAKDSVTRIEQLLSPEFLDFDMQAFSKVMHGKDKREEVSQILQEVLCQYCKHKDITIEAKSQEQSSGSASVKEWKISLPTEEVSFTALKSKPNKKSKSSWQTVRATFDYQHAQENSSLQFLALGHPFIDTMIQTINAPYHFGSHLLISKSKRKGFYFHLETNIHMDRSYRRLFSIFVPDVSSTVSRTNKKTTTLNFSSLVKWQIFSTDIDLSEKDFLAALEKAVHELYPQILEEVEKIQRRVQKEIDTQKNRLQTSHRQSHELSQEKLEIQKGKAKWFGEQKMSSAITRTKNQMRSAEMDHYRKIRDLNQMEKIKISLQVIHSVRFVN